MIIIFSSGFNSWCLGRSCRLRERTWHVASVTITICAPNWQQFVELLRAEFCVVFPDVAHATFSKTKAMVSSRMSRWFQIAVQMFKTGYHELGSVSYTLPGHQGAGQVFLSLGHMNIPTKTILVFLEMFTRGMGFDSHSPLIMGAYSIKHRGNRSQHLC